MVSNSVISFLHYPIRSVDSTTIAYLLHARYSFEDSVVNNTNRSHELYLLVSRWKYFVIGQRGLERNPLAWLPCSRAQVKERGSHMMQKQGSGLPPTCQAEKAVHMAAEGRHRLTTPHRRNYYELIEGLGMVARGLRFQNHASISFSLLTGWFGEDHLWAFFWLG